MSNILITGITGFIGSHLAEHLSQNTDNIIYGLQRSIKHESSFNVLKLYNNKNINLILGDVTSLTDTQEMLSKYDIEQVYHLAAQPIVQKASITPLSTYITNVFGTLTVLEAIRLTNIEIPTFVMSTDKAYGETPYLPYTEKTPLRGLDIYSSSKACEDILAQSYSYNYNLPIVIGRPSNAYGIDFNWTRLIPSLAKSCILPSWKDKPLILNKGSYHFIREYTYVKDTVRAIELLITNIDKTKGNAYNISSNHKYTTEEVVIKFLELTNNINKEIIFKEKQSTFKEIHEQYLDNSKLITTTKWKPKYNLEDGLTETIDKYKQWFKTS